MTSSKLTNLRLEQLTRTISDAVDVTYTSKGEATLVVDHRVVADVMEFLRDHRLTRMKVIVDIYGTDYPSRENRFDVVYSMLSIAFNRRLRVKTLVADGQPVESVRRLFSAALWIEREVWDLFGVFFSNHPDLRRILTDYGFQGHPFRKDFPLNGYTEARYDEGTKSVRTLPVEIRQEFRSFDFARPWEAMTDRS